MPKNQNKRESFKEGEDYYQLDGYIVMTEAFHLKRGVCCGSICKHCPFSPQYQKGNKKVQEKFGGIE